MLCDTPIRLHKGLLKNLSVFLLLFFQFSSILLTKQMSLKEKELYEFGQFRLDVAEHFLARSDSVERVPLSEKAFETLCILVRNAGHLVRKEELMNQVWADSFVEENNLDKCIFAIRRALGEKPGEQKYIETVRKHGYRFVAEVRRVEEAKPIYKESAADSEPRPFPTQNFPQLVEQTETPKTGAVVALAEWRRETDKHQPAESNGQPAKLELVPANPIIASRPKYRVLFAVGLILAVVFAGFGYGLYHYVNGKDPLPVFQSIQASRLTDNGTASLAEISPDGRFVAFANRDGGMESLVVRQIVTGNIVPIVQPAPAILFYQPSFTPDGDFIYYVLTDNGVGTLFRIPTLGGESKKIIVDVDSKVTVSPDGKRIAFIRHNPNEGGDAIIIANDDGTNPESFLQTKEINYDQFIGVDWSPENDKILVGVFKHKAEPNQKWRIATVGLNDKKLELVGEESWNDVENFEWLRNGAGIVLVGKANSGENSQIWNLSYPNGERRQITNDTSDYYSVSVSADGSLMVATRADAISSLWSRALQTGELRQLTAENKNMLGTLGLSQMPDGKILFVKRSGKKVNVFSIDETGGNEKQLTLGDSINGSPIATSDGKYIVFNSNRTGNFAIWRMNTDGKDEVQLTNGQTMIDQQPQITKDGRNIVFTRSPSDAGKTKLMKVSIDGGEAVLLMPENTMTEFYSRLSPDGKLIAYITFEFDTSKPNIEPEVRVVGFDGEKIDKSVKGFELVVNTEYRFSPDSKSLTYIKKGGIDNLWSLSLSDRTEKPLTDFTTGYISNFIWSNDGKKLFIIRAIYTSDLVLIKDGAKDDGGKYE